MFNRVNTFFLKLYVLCTFGHCETEAYCVERGYGRAALGTKGLSIVPGTPGVSCLGRVAVYGWTSSTNGLIVISRKSVNWDFFPWHLYGFL